MPKLKLNLNQIAEYCSFKHCLTPRLRAANITEVTQSLVGLHSARLSTPFVSLYARLPGFEAYQLQECMWDQKKLIKLRCMRKTLHTVTLDLAPVVHAASLRLRTADCIAFYRKNDIASEMIVELKSRLAEIIEREPRESAYLLESIGPSLSALLPCVAASWGDRLLLIVLKHLWEEGVLCYLNRATDWSSEKRHYGLTKAIYPNLQLDKYSETEAQVELARHHIAAYGPVAVGDITWWSGLSRRTVQLAIDRLKSSLVTIVIEDHPNELLMEAADFERLLRFSFEHEPWLSLLAYEDPTLKGYNETRRRYIADNHYGYLFNSIGEARASITINGRVVGIWMWNKSSFKVDYTLFEMIPSNMLHALFTEIAAVENWLRTQSSSRQLSLPWSQ